MIFIINFEDVQFQHMISDLTDLLKILFPSPTP